jgi:MscS family membrane protein
MHSVHLDRWSLSRLRRRFADRVLAGGLMAVLLLWPAHGIAAQFGLPKPAAPESTTDSARSPIVVSPASPRAAVSAFFDFSRQGSYEEAALYLEVPSALQSRRAELARRLREVLDQRLWVDLERLSPVAEGDTSDGDVRRDRVGEIAGAGGVSQPVMLRAVRDSSGRHWAFDAATVARIDAWYDALPDAWVRGRLPAALLREGPFNLYLWQWLGMLLALAVSLVLAAVLALAARWLLGQLTARTSSEWDDLMVQRLRGPFRLWLVGVLASPLFGVLGLNVRASSIVAATGRGIVIAAIFWAVLRVITVVQDHLLTGAWATNQPQARTLIPLLARILRVTVGVLALLVVLSQFGYSVSALLAGVGIGGVALALASQKTVEHMFGSVSLAADKVFRVGDYVRIGDLEGTVERIGLRSTSIRTLARTIVRIPNGRLAEERIESFGERDRFFFGHDIGVTYDTTTAQLRQIVDAITARLHEEPTLWTETVIVRTVAFADSAITLRVRAWFEVPDFAAFLAVQHELLLSIREIVETQGSSIAFPSRTVYHVYPGGEDTPAHLPPHAD